MNIKSRDDVQEAPVRESKPKYLWLGYGSYSNRATGGTFADAGMARAPKAFESIFEFFGLKKKTRRRSEGEE